LQLLTYALRLLRPGLDILSPAAGGPRRSSRTIGKSTQLTREITRIVETVDIEGITSSSLQIRKKGGLSVALMMQISGTRSIVPQDTI
jgi:hypothetical protein